MRTRTRGDGRRAQIARLGRRAAQGLREGSLTLRDIVGLTDEELQAMADAAAELRRRGLIEQATSLYGVLAAHDPLHASYWRALAQTNAALGRDVVAIAAYEVVAMLEDRRASDAAQEASCLERLDQPQLAREVRLMASASAPSADVGSASSLAAAGSRPAAGGLP